jgi:hypothetical protein
MLWFIGPGGWKMGVSLEKLVVLLFVPPFSLPSIHTITLVRKYTSTLLERDGVRGACTKCLLNFGECLCRLLEKNSIKFNIIQIYVIIITQFFSCICRLQFEIYCCLSLYCIRFNHLIALTTSRTHKLATFVVQQWCALFVLCWTFWR